MFIAPNSASPATNRRTFSRNNRQPRSAVEEPAGAGKRSVQVNVALLARRAGGTLVGMSAA